MGLIAQQPTTINGRQYQAEDPIVDADGKPLSDADVGNVNELVAIGLVVRVPDSALDVIVKARKGEVGRGGDPDASPYPDIPSHVPSTSIGAYEQGGFPDVAKADARPREAGMTEVDAPRAPEGVTFPRSVPSTSLGAYDARDGELVPPGEDGSNAEPVDDDGTAFDVAGSNIPAVIEYAEANPGSVGAVIEAEQARGDKARPRLIERLREIQSAE